MKWLLPFALVLAACSSPGPTAETDAKQAQADAGSVAATTTSRHPYAKHIELAGFRLRETSAGKLEIKFAAINHSPADLGDVALKIRITANGAAPEDPPIAEFEAKVPKWGPYEVKDASGTATTTLRVYELPDWQFLRASFEVTAPVQEP